ncbi:MAG TPA: DUF4294 domain-containing protein [Puia sp.]|nr:DUF4294 domain-containing protein [Puia sp.]
MFPRLKKYLAIFPFSVLLLTGSILCAQQGAPPGTAPAGQPSTSYPISPGQSDTAHPQTSPAQEPIPVPIQYGPYDTILVPAKIYNGEILSSRNMELSWVTAPMTPAMRKRIEEWTRLRNAVYVTYPFARKAGLIMNEMNAKLATITSESEKKAYLKSREKDLKKEFADPLEKLSVYQGRILMKLINRQTGNNCYDIIKEYKGGFTARLWQTVAFFFGSNLKQPYDPKGDDRQIEVIVQEVERMYRG